MKITNIIIGIILLLCFATQTGYSQGNTLNEFVIEKATLDKGAGGFVPTVQQPILDFIKSKEGYRSIAYKDAVGVWTIGYGHTGTARPGMRITKLEGESLLRKDARRFEIYVWKKANRPLKWHQFGALVSFTFNLGYVLKNDLLKGIQTGNDALVTYKMKLYIYAGGKVLRGLVTRRDEETQFYNGLESIIKRYSVCN